MVWESNHLTSCKLAGKSGSHIPSILWWDYSFQHQSISIAVLPFLRENQPTRHKFDEFKNQRGWEIKGFVRPVSRASVIALHQWTGSGLILDGTTLNCSSAGWRKYSEVIVYAKYEFTFPPRYPLKAEYVAHPERTLSKRSYPSHFIRRRQNEKLCVLKNCISAE